MPDFHRRCLLSTDNAFKKRQQPCGHKKGGKVSMVAADEGSDPALGGSKPPVLPLHRSAILAVLRRTANRPAVASTSIPRVVRKPSKRRQGKRRFMPVYSIQRARDYVKYYLCLFRNFLCLKLLLSVLSSERAFHDLNSPRRQVPKFVFSKRQHIRRVVVRDFA